MTVDKFEITQDQIQTLLDQEHSKSVDLSANANLVRIRIGTLNPDDFLNVMCTFSPSFLTVEYDGKGRV